jgi:hypothetical protein
VPISHKSFNLHTHELPYLHGVALRNTLNEIFAEYTTEVVLEKLVPCLNLQRNENLNGTIGSKNPKIRYYGDSESSDFRIACGVAQHNESRQYVSKTLTTLGINPGKQCEDYHKILDRKQVKDPYWKVCVSRAKDFAPQFSPKCFTPKK